MLAPRGTDRPRIKKRVADVGLEIVVWLRIMGIFFFVGKKKQGTYCPRKRMAEFLISRPICCHPEGGIRRMKIHVAVLTAARVIGKITRFSAKYVRFSTQSFKTNVKN